MKNISKIKIAANLTGVSFFLLAALFFSFSLYKTYQGKYIVMQRAFYDEYEKLSSEQKEQELSNNEQHFKVYSSAFGQSDEIFLISKIAYDCYIITYGTGRQFVCSSFPEKTSLPLISSHAVILDILTIVISLFVLLSLVLTFFLLKTQKTAPKQAACK